MQEIELHPFIHNSGPAPLSVENIDYVNPYDYKSLHRHSYFELLLFDRGYGGKQIIDFNEYNIESETLYVIVPGQVHLMKRSFHENGMLIQFTKEYLARSVGPIYADCFYLLCSSPQIKLTRKEFLKLKSISTG